jgi:CRISPR/Cas system-associated endonuclease Cas1
VKVADCITEKDFETGSNGNYLKQTGQQKVLRQFDERLNKTIRHRELKRNVSYLFVDRSVLNNFHLIQFQNLFQ